MRWDTRVGFIVGGLLLAHTAARAQPTFRSATELVNLNVTVVDTRAEPVQGLTPQQFQVLEDGVPQELKFFAAGEMPLDVVILLDTSASMTGSMELVQGAAMRLARALRPHDRAAVMGIAGGLRVLQAFTDDKTAVMSAIRATRPGGRTPLYGSIYTVLRELDKTRRADAAPRRQAIVVLSDGQDTSSGLGFDDLMDSARRHAVPIYTIAPRPSKTVRAMREAMFGETTRERDFELRKLAAETGARAFFPVTVHDLSGVYDEIARELAHQYSLGYRSTNGRVDGGFRRIALRVTIPGVTWRTRSGYVAEAAGNGDAVP